MNEAWAGSSQLGERIVVVGTTGSGKTTTARQLSLLLGLPHIELDALFWGEKWTPVPPEIFRERVALAVEEEAWVADGNYSPVRDIVWARAETIIWLDYSFVTTFLQLFGRTVRRIVSGEELWSGNRERFAGQFLSRESLLLYAVTTYRRRRRQYAALLTSAEHAHLTLVRLRSPKETRAWLSNLELGIPSPRL